MIVWLRDDGKPKTSSVRKRASPEALSAAAADPDEGVKPPYWAACRDATEEAAWAAGGEVAMILADSENDVA